ncbi:MAG: SDR family NAD(P)-dependent oxidoreductase [Planctomycetota bacterium]|nr:MAG: SDR family NAD(P)-dependent oxidoreductase [Planctomycetota bacterium]
MQNRVVVITGASSGIGAATARRLATSSRLLLVARRQQRLQDLVAQINDEGGSAHALAVDVTADDAPARIVAACREHYGGMDVLINNAGIFTTADLAASDDQHIAQLLDLNVRVPMALTREALPLLTAGGGGWVVNVSSVAATTAFPGCGVYAASKAALEQWSAVIREELRQQGVRVSVIAPGATDTEVWDGRQVSRQGMCRAEDVAAAIHYSLDQAPSVSVDRVVVAPPAGAL